MSTRTVAAKVPVTIRLRLTLWYTALLGATLILFSVTFYSVLSTNLWTQAQWNMENQAQEVARYLSQQLSRDLGRLNDPQSLQLPISKLFASSIGVQIVRLDGMVVMRSSNLGSMVIPKSTTALNEARRGHSSRYRISSSDGTALLIYSLPLVVNDFAVLGVVQVIQPVEGVEGTLRQVAQNLIFGTALSLLIAALVGALLAQRALAPIQEITDTARHITRTKDLGQRLAMAQDTSEVGQLAATFNEMLDQIQQLFTAQQRLTADVSHELRSPLTIIQGNVDLLQRMVATESTSSVVAAVDTGDAAPARPLATPLTGFDQARVTVSALQEALSEVESETERMGHMIGDLLLLAQADSGLQLKMDAVEMDTLLLEIYRQTRRVAERRKGLQGLTVRLGSEDQAQVWGDRGRLRQLLLNLTDNAIKYTPAGGTITLGLEQSDGWVRVTVEDTGIGIGAEDLAHIFDRFYRVDKARSRSQGGSGLGLSIARWIAEAHRGRITVTSAPGQGSLFTVWLPAAAGAQHETAP